MNKILSNKYLQFTARLFVGFVFVYAGIGKIGDPATFATEIFNYHILPNYIINIIALILPWLEVIIGIFLIAGVYIRASAAIASISLLLFIVAVLSAMFRGLDINCGCFADKVVMVGWKKVFEDLIILLFALLPLLFSQNSKPLDKNTSD